MQPMKNEMVNTSIIEATQWVEVGIQHQIVAEWIV
jgi:hypothetical protein